MKSYNHLWEKLITKENFELAYKNSIKGKSKQQQIIEFNKNKEENLEAVRQLVISGQFTTSEYKEKIIYEPKQRTIYKLPYCPDRIVQHAIMNILKPILTNLFIDNTFACIEGRGQLKASQKCSEFTRRNTYCLKCDIHKFYPSINQKILSDMFHRIIKDKKFLEILDDIIFSYPGETNCPIGNLCSQWFGNFYLTKLDNYILHELKPNDYQRYCDDFILYDTDKQFLNTCKIKIEQFLAEELELSFSKADLFSLRQGVDFVGYRHFGKYILIRKSTSFRLKRRFRNITKQLNQDNYNKQRIQGQIASANGLLKHSCSNHLRQSINFYDLANKVELTKF